MAVAAVMAGRQKAYWLAAGCALIALAGLYILSKHDGTAIWRVVHDQCMVNYQATLTPAPCERLDLSHGREQGYALLKPLHAEHKFLLIPTTPVAGIESPALIQARAVNYFAAAWRARDLLEQKAGHPLPRDTMSVAVNSVFGRSQDQLHLHVDCLRPEVTSTLHQQLGKITGQWATLPVLLMDHEYRAMRFSEAELDVQSPFLRLAADVEKELDSANSTQVATEMGLHTLVLAGVTFEDGTPGFVLLDHRADLWRLDRAHGEELQNHSCENL